MDLPQTRETTVARIAELLSGIRTAIVTTVTTDGRLHSRPMASQDMDFDGVLWFVTRRDTDKVHEARDNHHASVAFVDSVRNRYVTLSGSIRIVEDRAKIHEIWHEALNAWFPNGPADPELTLLRMEPVEASFWEGPASRLSQAFRIVQALTGLPPA